MSDSYLIDTITHINTLIADGKNSEEVFQILLKLPPPYNPIKTNLSPAPIWSFLEGAATISDILHHCPNNILMRELSEFNNV